MLGKKESKSDGDCVENTDFAYAATSRPGHMPRQLPARLSGIRSIELGCSSSKQQVIYLVTTFYELDGHFKRVGCGW